MPRAVLDPSVLISALISSRGAPARLLVELTGGSFELVTSPSLLAELDEVLRRQKFQGYVSGTEVDAYVELIRRNSVVVEDPEPSREHLSVDPDDEYLIDLARLTRVDALVSGDSHLLALRDRLPVITAREFLDVLTRIDRSG